MGFYIDMEMPTAPVLFCIHPDGKVFADLEGGWREYKAIPVPKHGDLIDRYDLKNKKITIDYDEWDDTFEDGLLFVADLIDNAPTIIPADPAEEGE